MQWYVELCIFTWFLFLQVLHLKTKTKHDNMLFVFFLQIDTCFHGNNIFYTQNVHLSEIGQPLVSMAWSILKFMITSSVQGYASRPFSQKTHIWVV